MRKLAVLLVLSLPPGFARNCVTYGAPITLTGKLLLQDEAGYDQFIALKPDAAICAVADRKDVAEGADSYDVTQRGVKEIQASVYGSDSVSDALRDRLNRLIGRRVVIKGEVSPATTGYDRTRAVLRVNAVDAADLSGRRALDAPRAEIRVRDVDVYDLTIKAGKRLVIEAHEKGSTTPLLPPNQFFTHWMTGGEVVYVDCRDGYERSLISSTAKGGGICFDGAGLCGLSAFPNRPVTIKLRCTKKR